MLNFLLFTLLLPWIRHQETPGDRPLDDDKTEKMIAYNSNEDSPHADVAWVLWYAADVAHALGQLVSIDYSDDTPDVAFTYDRLGRQLTVTDVLGTRTNVYSPTDLLEERHPEQSGQAISW